MTTILNQVTCSLRDMKIDELQWEDHIFFTTHLKKSRDVKTKM